MSITVTDIQGILKDLGPNTKKNMCCSCLFKNSNKLVPYEASKGWKNFAENLKEPDSTIFDINSIPTLQALMKSVTKRNETKDPENKITLRPVAGGQKKDYSDSFSFTPCTEADIKVRMPQFQKVEIVDVKKRIIRVGAGVRIGDLDRLINEGLIDPATKGKFKFSLPTSSLLPYATFVGLADNSGHGTGIEQPGIAGLIRAITICRPDGVIERIDETHADFYTIRAGFFSLLGVVIDVEIECIDCKKLQCVTEARTVEDFIDEVENDLLHQNEYTSAMYIPTYDEMSAHPSKNVIVERWKPVGAEEKDVNNHPTLRKIAQSIQLKLLKFLGIDGLLRKNPEEIPAFMRGIVAKVEVGDKDAIAVGPWPDIAHYQEEYPRNIDDSDYLFTFKKGGKRVAQALRGVVNILNHYAEKHQYPVVDAIYLRFFKGTNGGMSTSYHENDEYVCGFDIVSDPTMPGYKEFKKDIQDFFMNTMNARPHWGKTVPLNLDFAKVIGKGFQEFKGALTRWYEKCKVSLTKSPLINAFHKTILQLVPKPELTLVADEKEEKRRNREWDHPWKLKVHLDDEEPAANIPSSVPLMSVG